MNQLTVTDRVMRILMTRHLGSLTRAGVAERMYMSNSTLARRLAAEGEHYQSLLDKARKRRCQNALARQSIPGKCLAEELGYSSVNSFYRAFRSWIGISYRDYRTQLRINRPANDPTFNQRAIAV